MKFTDTDIPFRLLNSIQNSLWRYTYKGVLLQKNPFDLALYTKLIWDAKPHTIIEIGSQSGGSAIWFADQLVAQGIDGQVISIDINKVDSVSHPRVKFIQGDAFKLGDVLPKSIIDTLPRPFLVVEDSAHTRKISSAVLEYMEPFMRAGEYFVVEDGIIDHLPAVKNLFDGGPSAAIASFLEVFGNRWMIDRQICDFFGYNVTWNTNGYLLKLTNSDESLKEFEP